jgi:acyl-CoA thioesterase
MEALNIAKAMLAGDRLGRSLGIELIEAGPGSATLAMTVTDAMLNGFDTCHGGAMFTLADTALSCACNSHNERSVAHHCTVIYLRAARLGDRLIATAVERCVVGRVGIYAVAIHDGGGQVVAEFLGHARVIGGAVIDS